MKCTFASLLSSIALFVIVPSAAQGAAFTNGSFELPGLPPGTFVYLAPGDTRLAGWSIGGAGGPVGHFNNDSFLTGPSPGPFDAVDGTHQVSFNTGDLPPGNFISQSFDTTVGQRYAVTFFVGRLGFEREGADISLTASVLSETGDTLTSLRATPYGLGYSGSESVYFTADSATSTLLFTDTSLETRAVDILLDDIVVTAIPEPSRFELATLAALGGMAMVFARRRARRRSRRRAWKPAPERAGC